MSATAKVNGAAPTALTVGQVAELLGVTVRTLHHYDQIVVSEPLFCPGLMTCVIS